MLSAHHLCKSYDIQPVLHDVSLNLNPGDRIGLIGPNGSGKTTLLRILTGAEEPDSGTITYQPPDVRIGYLEQGFPNDSDEHVGSFLWQGRQEPAVLESELARLADLLGGEPARVDLQEAYDWVLVRLAEIDQRRDRALHVLHSLGLAEISPDVPVRALSGGQKTRLALAGVLLGEPQLLLLDEPTNHLDIRMLEWLEDWLAAFPGPALVVSHDRAFLDNTVHAILELDPTSHRIRSFAGNYTDYLEQVLQERDKQASKYRDQVEEIRRLRQDIQRTKGQARQVELTTTSRQPGPRRYAKKVARKAKSREKKLERYLYSGERVEKPRQSWQMKVEFEKPAHLSQQVLTIEELTVGYPGREPVLCDINLAVRSGDRIALTGPNGGGKTTLLRAIAGMLEPREGAIRVSSGVKVGYMTQEQELLDMECSALEMIQAAAPLSETDARKFLHKFLFEGDEPLRPARLLSCGERARLALAILVADGCNFLLLDEPINYLDIPSRSQFEQSLLDFRGTILMVVHDRYFIQRLATQLWVLENGTIAETKHIS